MNKDRFWGSLGIDGRLNVLYRLSYPDRLFQRWDNGKWVDDSDRYERVTQDVDHVDIDLVTAVQFMKAHS